MFKITVDTETCEACEACISNCPNSVYEMIDGKSSPVRPEDCEGCESCVEGCPAGAITVSSPVGI